MESTAYLLMLFVGLSYVCDATGSREPGVPYEYCDGEIFAPRCYQADEVIVVTQADYGLISRGRCLNIDYGHIGCFADVISHVAGICSGRRSCDLRISDPVLDNMTSNCPHEFRFFLNATYTCVKVERRTCSSCESSGNARVTSPERGLLASVVTAETQGDEGCGSTRCPWLIEVRPGQVINLTLFDFGRSNVDRSSSRPISSLSYPSSSESQCTGPRYAIIKERANPRETLVCGGNKNGQKHVYTSISNHVEVHVISRDVLEWSAQFIVEYEAIGCADVIPPRHTWMKRTENTVEVGCPTTGAKWLLSCVDGKWMGEMGKSCPGVPGVSIPGDVQTLTVTKPTTSFLADFPMNVLIAAVIAVACIIGVFILTLGIVCIKRHQYKKRHPASRPSSIYARATSEFEFHGELRSAGAGPEATPMMPMSSSRPRPGPPTATKPRLSVGRQYPDGLIGYDAEQQFAAVAARRAIGSRPLPSIPGGSAERRPGGPYPLQTTVQLHPTTGSMQSACTCHSHPRGPAYCYPANPPSLAPKVRSIGTGPTADGGWPDGGALYGNTILPYTDDQHHYFVLDPEVVQDCVGPVTPLLPPPSPTTISSQHQNILVSPTNGTVTVPAVVNTIESDPGLRFPTPPPPLAEAELTTKSTVVARRQSPDGKEREEDRDVAVNEELNKNRCSVHEIPLRPSRDGQSLQGKGVTTAATGGGPEGIDMGTSSWP